MKNVFTVIVGVPIALITGLFFAPIFLLDLCGRIRVGKGRIYLEKTKWEIDYEKESRLRWEKRMAARQLMFEQILAGKQIDPEDEKDLKR